MIHICLKKKLNGAEGPLALDVDIHFAQKEFVSIYGQSGAGKTSILKMIAGLMKPDEGRIEVGDQIWFDSSRGINLPTQQ